MNRLTERRDYNCPCWNGDTKMTIQKRYIAMLDRLAEYEDAEEAGLLVKLPCALGTVITQDEPGYDITITNIGVYAKAEEEGEWLTLPEAEDLIAACRAEMATREETEQWRA